MRGIGRKLTICIFHSNTIFIQLVVFTLVVSIIPVSVISSLLFSQTSDSIERTLNQTYEQIVIQYMSNMNETLFKYQYRLHQIANNTVIMDELLNKGSDTNPYVKGKKVAIEISKSLGVEDYNKFRNCIVYSNVKDAKIYGDKVSMVEIARSEQWYLNNKILKEGALIYTGVSDESKILSLIQDIQYIEPKSLNAYDLGFVKLNLNVHKLFEPVKQKTEEFYPYDIIVVDQDDDLIYTSNPSLVNYLEEIPLETLSRKSMLFKDNIMVYGDSIDTYGLKVIFLFEGDLFVKKQEELQKFMIPMLLILVGFIAMTTYIFTRSFSKRVGRLVNKIKLAEEGNFSVTEEIRGHDEIAVLDKQFNLMLERLEQLIQKNYIHQLEKKKAELKNLQLQINPHFLYNTLETISSMAAVKQVFEICNLCEKLGEIFRYSIGKNHGDYVTVEQELKHIQNYVFIQEARFGSKFDVYYEVEATVIKNQVLRFILQPIVENAIIHGLSMKPTKGNLKISVKQEEQYLIIKIEDDGVGITPRQLKSLKEYINDNDTKGEMSHKGIGIRNVNQRIKLSYGTNYGIVIQSELNYGSCFTIQLPFIQ